MTPTTEADRQVAVGAKFLDGDRPGWDRRMSLRRLDVADVGDCPAGQVYGHYRHVVRKVGSGSGYGFYSSWYNNDPSYRELTRAWRRLLLARGVADDRWWGRRLLARLIRH